MSERSEVSNVYPTKIERCGIAPFPINSTFLVVAEHVHL